MTDFQPDKFMDDYNKWRGLSFLTNEADEDAVYDLRYDLYELDANLAGVWINFVDSGLKDIDPHIDDRQLQELMNRAKKLRNKVNKNDAVLVGSYIEYMNLMVSMYANYKRLSS